jgi:hypothetical protein
MACKQGIRERIEVSKQRAREKKRDDPLPNRTDQTPPVPLTLPRLCYNMAYFILPYYAFKECDKLVSICMGQVFALTDEGKAAGLDPAGAFFYHLTCQTYGVKPTQEDTVRFQSHHGQTDAEHDYFSFEYPIPPSVSFPEALAPYFSGIIRHRGTKAVRYYVLGQSPIGRTTLRSVTEEGRNYNLGPGPEPNLNAFLASIGRQSFLEEKT